MGMGQLGSASANRLVVMVSDATIIKKCRKDNQKKLLLVIPVIKNGMVEKDWQRTEITLAQNVGKKLPELKRGKMSNWIDRPLL
jgi:ribosomal protein L18